jgi:tripartite-type tricarboxylate transporter receptor subunit TctC
VRLPEIAARLAEQLFDVRTGTPEEFAALIKSDVARWRTVVHEGNIKPE